MGSEGLEQALDYVYGSSLVQQRCIFHQLRNGSRQACRLGSGREKALHGASCGGLSSGFRAPEARARLVVVAEHWRATQPQAVATCEREFEQTIRSYALEGIVREVVRTTSRLERTKREWRRTFRQGGCFSSPRGAEVAVYIQVTRLNAESG